MNEKDTAFRGNIPALYDRCMGPLFFEPYAEDIARRVAAFRPERVVEVAAGTGIVTCALAAALDGAEIAATDLNQQMLDVASSKPVPLTVRFSQADAMALPFDDDRFDAAVCQFGAMFFPDRIAAYRETARVLRPGGVFIFNVWDELEENPVSRIVAETLEGMFPDQPPSFIRRVPFGYHDKCAIEREVREAGFDTVAIETVKKRSRSASAREAALGLCAGTPAAAQLEEAGKGRLDEAVELTAANLSTWVGHEGLDAPMSAHVVIARLKDQ